MWGDFVAVIFQSSTAVLLRIQVFLDVILFRSIGVPDISKYLQIPPTTSQETQLFQLQLPTVRQILQAFLGKPKKYENNVIQDNGP